MSNVNQLQRVIASYQQQCSDAEQKVNQMKIDRRRLQSKVDEEVSRRQKAIEDYESKITILKTKYEEDIKHIRMENTKEINRIYIDYKQKMK